MAGGLSSAIELYQQGKSLTDVSEETGVAKSTLRRHLKDRGCLRSRTEGIRLVRHKLGSGMRGKNRVFSDAHKAAISEGRSKWADKCALGTSVKPNGYVEYTRGEHKGRSVHVVTMEQRIGRRLKPDEVVHHIDGDRSNNNPNNLALMTRSAHARLHRREDALAGNYRGRNEDGRFS